MSRRAIRLLFVIVAVAAGGAFIVATHWRHPGVAALIVAVISGIGVVVSRQGSSLEEYGDHHHDD